MTIPDPVEQSVIDFTLEWNKREEFSRKAIAEQEASDDPEEYARQMAAWIDAERGM